MQLVDDNWIRKRLAEQIEAEREQLDALAQRAFFENKPMNSAQMFAHARRMDEIYEEMMHIGDTLPIYDLG